MRKGLINSVAQWKPPFTPLYRMGINLLVLSWADKEIPTTDVKLELEPELSGGSDQIPNLALHCAPRSPSSASHRPACPCLHQSDPLAPSSWFEEEEEIAA